MMAILTTILRPTVVMWSSLITLLIVEVMMCNGDAIPDTNVAIEASRWRARVVRPFYVQGQHAWLPVHHRAMLHNVLSIRSPAWCIKDRPTNVAD